MTSISEMQRAVRADGMKKLVRTIQAALATIGCDMTLVQVEQAGRRVCPELFS